MYILCYTYYSSKHSLSHFQLPPCRLEVWATVGLERIMANSPLTPSPIANRCSPLQPQATLRE